jgi:hypothetical protein
VDTYDGCIINMQCNIVIFLNVLYYFVFFKKVNLVNTIKVYN